MKLERDFYTRDALTVAPDLLGKLLFSQTPQGLACGRIVETEAYVGPWDKAAHSCRKSVRTGIQYGEGGFAYVYLIYGMYWCLNIVANEPGKPECVLIRALEPVSGLELMKARRKTEKVLNLCSGPGKLCRALEIDGGCKDIDLCGGRLWLEDDGYGGFETGVSERINIAYAEEAVFYPWRFFVKDSPWLSVK